MNVLSWAADHGWIIFAFYIWVKTQAIGLYISDIKSSKEKIDSSIARLEDQISSLAGNIEYLRNKFPEQKEWYQD